MESSGKLWIAQVVPGAFLWLKSQYSRVSVLENCSRCQLEKAKEEEPGISVPGPRVKKKGAKALAIDAKSVVLVERLRNARWLSTPVEVACWSILTSHSLADKTLLKTTQH